MTTKTPRVDLYVRLRDALIAATGFDREIGTEPNKKDRGSYYSGTGNIGIAEDMLFNPRGLCHTVTHEFGHSLAYKIFPLLQRKQSDLEIISTQARRRILTKLWPELARNEARLKYFQRVRGGTRGAEFAAEVICAYLMDRVIPDLAAECGHPLPDMTMWSRLPGLVYTETYGYCPASSRRGAPLLAGMIRELEAMVKLPAAMAVAA